MIDHVTYQIPSGTLWDEQLTQFFSALELEEVAADEKIEQDWKVRWWRPADGGPLIHVVEASERGGYVPLGLGHFCSEISREGYESAKDSPLREPIGSGEYRIWLRGPFGLRAEVRPRAAAQDQGDGLRSEQEKVLMRALAIYLDRNERYKDNWRRFGLRGCLFRIRERAERAFDDLWDAPVDTRIRPDTTLAAEAEADDLLDLINFAVFAVRAIEEGNRDGTGGWW